ncbi:MAG: DNA repair exonuclease [Thermoanaerobacteraceae bacterium]|nr:DNA repair exonuclease [Thermoanaerobacteraceae bacterium]
MGRKVRFIHSADIHLGSPLKALGTASGFLRQKLMDASYTAFARVVDAALRYEADFVLLSGDIYDSEVRSVSANQFLSEQLRRLEKAGVPVFIIHGNHDPIGDSREYVRLPGNVTVFGHEQVEVREVFNKDGYLVARVLGQSYRNVSESRKMYQTFTPPDDNAVNIGMLHTGLNPAANAYVPCSLEDLKSRETIDYWALGHIHRTSIISREKPAVAFPGIPQGRDAGEPGWGGCLLVEVEKGKSLEISFVPTASFIWLTQEVCISEAAEPPVNVDDLVELIAAKARQLLNAKPELPESLVPAALEKTEVEGYLVRWVVTGRGTLHDELIAGREEEIARALEARLRQLLGSGSPFIWTERVQIRTGRPIPDLAMLLERDRIFRTLNEIYHDLMHDPAKRKQALSVVGSVWFQSKDHEDVRRDALPLDDGKFKELLLRARDLVVEKIIEGRDGE